MTTRTFTAAEKLAHADGLTVMDPHDPEGRRRPGAQKVCDNAAAMLRADVAALTAASEREAALQEENERLTDELSIMNIKVSGLHEVMRDSLACDAHPVYLNTWREVEKHLKSLGLSPTEPTPKQVKCPACGDTVTVHFDGDDCSSCGEQLRKPTEPTP